MRTSLESLEAALGREDVDEPSCRVPKRVRSRAHPELACQRAPQADTAQIRASLAQHALYGPEQQMAVHSLDQRLDAIYEAAMVHAPRHVQAAAAQQAPLEHLAA